MTDFEREFREGLGVILEEPVPSPEVGAVRFYGQWLAERNLGLVPIADAATFAWAGTWLARVRLAEGGDHTVVMDSAPSGPVFDPAGAVSRGGAIVEGWLVAPLDLGLPTAGPTARTHRLVGGWSVHLLEGRGTVGSCRPGSGGGRPGARRRQYFTGEGTFSGPGRGYQLTLVQAESLDEVDLSWEEARRNVVTRGVTLNALVGRRFHIGPVECVGRRLAEPRAHLDSLTRPGLLRPLVHRAGLRADIVVSGMIESGDPVAPDE